MNRLAIITALEMSGSRCCDVEDDREAIADVICEVLRNQRDALQVRELFAHAPNIGAKTAVVASDGRRLEVLINAAWRLAGGGQ